MPNWVTNTIKPVKSEDWNKLKELLLNENGDVDFHVITPISKDLDITSGSFSYVMSNKPYKEGLFKKQTDVIDKILEPYYNNTITQKEFTKKVLEKLTEKQFSSFIETYNLTFNNNIERIEYIENIVKGFFNYNRYGYPDWWDANIELWGTKWNAHYSIVNDCTKTIEFDTAWSCPLPIIKKISQTVSIIVTYADEDLGYNYGAFRIDNGNITDIIDNQSSSIGSAIALKMYDREYVEEYFSEFNYTDDEINKWFEGKTREELTKIALEDYDHAIDILGMC